MNGPEMGIDGRKAEAPKPDASSSLARSTFALSGAAVKTLAGCYDRECLWTWGRLNERTWEVWTQ